MSEPMVTIKNADGTTSQVPLSQLAAKKDPSTAVTPPTVDEPTTVSSKPEVVESTQGERVTTDPEPPQTEVVHRVTLDEVREAKPAPVQEEPTPVVSTVDTEVVQTVDVVEDAEDEAPAEPVLDPASTAITPEIETSTETEVPPPVTSDEVFVEEEGEELPLESTETMEEVAEQGGGTESEYAPEAVEDNLAIVGEQHLATTTPNTGMFEHADTEHAWDADDHKSLLEEDVSEVHAEPAKPVQIPLAPEPTPIQIGPSESATIGTKKVPMQDISVQSVPTTAGRTALSGPTGELATITLDDFRRLGGRDTIGLADLRAKFETLLKESTLLYMEGVQAWQQSPLFRNYVEITAESVRSGRPVSDILDASAGMQLDEWQAINSLQQDVRL